MPSAAVLKSWLIWAQIGSLVAIPVVIAVAGWLVQREIAEQAIRKDYVQLAVGILREPDANQSGEVRKWAIDVLAKHSPVTFTPELRKGLTFATIFPEHGYKAPPRELMEPPLPYQAATPLPGTPELSAERARREADNSARFKQNADRLQALQAYVATLQRRLNPRSIDEWLDEMKKSSGERKAGKGGAELMPEPRR